MAAKIETTAELTAISEAWHAANSLPFACAYETLAEVEATTGNASQYDWLCRFLARWDEAQRREDLAAIRAA